MTAPSPEAFLALTSTDEDHEEDVQQPTSPLESIAASLEAMTRAVVDIAIEGRPGADLVAASRPDTELQERYFRLSEEYDDLEAKHQSLYDLLADVEKIVSKSKSQVSLEVKAAINAWRNPEVPAEGVPAGEPAASPALDADAEDWREYARAEGFGEQTGHDLSQMNRSQIRTLLGLPQTADA